MKQIVQRPRDGSISVREVPIPSLQTGSVLVANRYSLISTGTERAKVEFGSKHLIAKARSRPDLVRKVVDRARVEGSRAALTTAFERLDALAPLGYSSAGVVVAVGRSVEGIAPGDHVACAGVGFANHAELISVPRNLVAVVPPSVDLAAACYATVGAIAMHAVRQGRISLGERVGVIGLGLVGQLAVRIAAAAGASIYGIDLDPAAVELAAAAGVQALLASETALEARVLAATRGDGLDAVLVCASSRSPGILDRAARLLRDRGRLVVVGDIPVTAARSLLYEKEIELQMSRSYGPGRYDIAYEERGLEYPIGYVRWTEQRNLQLFVDLVASGRVDPTPLTTHRFPVDDAERAFALLREGREPRAFGIVLEYAGGLPPEAPENGAEQRKGPQRAPRRRRVRIGLIGAGAFARTTLLPALVAADAELAALVSGSGLSAADVARRYGFERTASSTDEILGAADIDAVVIATRHGQHAALAAEALAAGKAVFVEKPLALTDEELECVRDALESESVLMVGFNRRFAPLTERLRALSMPLPGRVLSVRVNAGPLPAGHWLYDPDEGGGRLLGEGCHFVDLLCHLAGAPPVVVTAVGGGDPTRPPDAGDSASVTLTFNDGTVGTLVYAGVGDTRLAKERIEVFGGGTAAVLDDFRRLEVYASGRRRVEKARQDKGHRAELAAFVAAAAGRAGVAVESYLESTRATLAAAESIRTGRPVRLR